jgi:hypothetical protein
MEAFHDALFPLFVDWDALRILVLIYQHLRGNREEDQIFLNASRIELRPTPALPAAQAYWGEF